MNNTRSANKNSATDIIVKILTVACIVAALFLITVLGYAFLGGANKGDAVTTESVAPPEIVATTESTTESTTSEQVKVKKNVYVKAEAAARVMPSKSGEVVFNLSVGESVGYISRDSNGWCKILYGDRVCYVPTKNLSVKKPELAQATTETSEVEESTDITELTSEAEVTEVEYNSDGRKVINPYQKQWYLVVVNHTRSMPDGYEPELAYVAGSDYELDSRVAPYYDKMYNAAAAEGIYLTPVSGFRYYSSQERNLNALISDYMYQYDLSEADARAKAETEILPPGCSEHNLGLAMDICSVDESFMYTAAYEWLVENAHNYGFIERYPVGTQSITGVIAEPWHWRFVGPAYAKKIKASGLTLEEYFDQNGINY